MKRSPHSDSKKNEPTPRIQSATPDLPRSREELLTAYAKGLAPDLLMFWSHEPKATEPGPWVLSQWFAAPFQLEGICFRTAEQFMMVQKARLFSDVAAETSLLESASPHQAKRIGRQVSNFDEATWKRHRVGIVEKGNLAKFSQNQSLRSYLVNTGSNILVEASPHDQIWGIGLRGSDLRAWNPFEWRGQNLLGFALMKVRSLLAQGIVASTT